LLITICQAYAADLSDLNNSITYREVKTWYEQFLRGEPTKAQRVEAWRQIIRTSQLGERGLNNVFRNFQGNYSLDPHIPGVEKSVLMLRSASKSQAKGYRRELLYAAQFHNAPRFELTAMNKVLKRPWGDTDADMVVRHKPTGLYARFEIKDYIPESQSRNLPKIKKQIDKMAKERQYTGQPQFWINRREVSPRIKQYANEKGVYVLENVKTGYSTEGTPIKKAINIVETEISKAARVRAILGGGSFAFGTWMLMDAAPTAWNDLQTVWNPDLRTTQAWLRLGEHGSYALAGSGMVLSGGALTASRYASEKLQGKLYRYGRVGGNASLASIGLAEGFLISRHAAGDVSSREFWTTQWILGTTATGGASGAWVGGAIMGLSPFKIPSLGSFLGATTGTWFGETIGKWTADWHYKKHFALLDQRFGEFVYNRYGVK
jgi:hypothetical protein